MHRTNVRPGMKLLLLLSIFACMDGRIAVEERRMRVASVLLSLPEFRSGIPSCARSKGNNNGLMRLIFFFLVG